MMTENPVPVVSVKPVKSFATSLRGEGGAVARATALRRKDGSYTTFVAVWDGKKNAEGKRITTRGATASYPTLEGAQGAVKKLAAGLVAKGWTEHKGGGRSFAARADAFDAANLPAPPKHIKK
jgi:hypothetical protein